MGRAKKSIIFDNSKYISIDIQRWVDNLNTKSIDILSTNYKIWFIDDSSCHSYFKKCLDDNSICNGYCDCNKKEIIIYNTNSKKYWEEADDNSDVFGDEEKFMKRILRHEILHAFLYESGLDFQSNNKDPWSLNEEMIDWFAIQSPKIYKVYEYLDILE